jgi:alpha-D-ribose 1-methylphosphonate 5-triphosphate synthase subunit PhnH
MNTQALSGGFENTPHQSSTAFRSIMNAMARPGAIEFLSGAEPPEGLSLAASTLLLTLCDPETPVYLAGVLDCENIRDWLVFHTGAPLVGANQALFAVGTWDALMPIIQFSIGTAQYPDRSTSLIVECSSLVNKGPNLTGPGIKDSIQLNLPDTEALKMNAALFPLGCDFYFTSDSQIAALPRTTQIGALKCM